LDSAVRDLLKHRFPELTEADYEVAEFPEWLRRLGIGVKKYIEWEGARLLVMGCASIGFSLFVPLIKQFRGELRGR